jgi:hypothetical protein
MDHEPPTSVPTGRDIAGAWLVCLLIGVLALGLSSTIQQPMPAPSTMAAKPSTCGSDLRSGCLLSAKAASKNLSAAAGLHSLSVPELRPGNRHCS